MISPLERIRNLADRYLQTDLDHITATQLSQDIAIIQGITNDIAEADELQVICQLLSKMTSHLYVARGHALASVPRSLPFYENMIKSQQLLKQIIKAME